MAHFQTKIAVKPNTVNKTVKATCLLHNMLQANTTPVEVTAILEQEVGDTAGILGLVHHSIDEALATRDH